jgi:hypothetical protein
LSSILPLFSQLNIKTLNLETTKEGKQTSEQHNVNRKKTSSRRTTKDSSGEKQHHPPPFETFNLSDLELCNNSFFFTESFSFTSSAVASLSLFFGGRNLASI